MSDGTPEKSELRASIDANAKKKKKLLVFGGGAVAVALVAGIVAIAVTSANAPGKEAVAGESETLSITIAGAGETASFRMRSPRWVQKRGLRSSGSTSTTGPCRTPLSSPARSMRTPSST